MTRTTDISTPKGFPLLSRAKLLGRIGGILFLLALFCVFDSVQFLVRMSFNTVEVVAGKNKSISGILPHEISDAGEMIFFLKGPGARDLSFSPTAAFRGFWLGGDMWRGTISANPAANTGEIILTIVDLVPAKRVQKDGEETIHDTEEPILVQNPGLVYTIKVWATQKEADRASISLITRTTGFSAPLLSVLLFLLALGVSVLSFLTMRKAEAMLGHENTFIIHGSRILPHGIALYFTIPRGMELSTEKTPLAALRLPSGEIQAEGTFTEIARGKGTALFTEPMSPPGYGWLISLR